MSGTVTLDEAGRIVLPERLREKLHRISAERACIVSLALFCLPHNASPQLLYFGIKAGTPLSDSTASAMVVNRGGSGLSTLNVRRYTVGPTFEIGTPFRVSFEADALYTRLDRTEHRFLSPTIGSIYRLKGNAWEFPLLLKYAWKRETWRPFVAGGGTLRHIGSFEGSTETFAGGLQPPYNLIRYHLKESLTQGGLALGAGVRVIAFGPLKVTAELRYTRWTSARFLPARNQMQLLVGVGF